jgi:MFS family permease
MRQPVATRQWTLLLAAGVILLITMGVRQSMGLFLDPVVASTGVGIAAISFALAIGQLVWGAAQPLFGAIADHYGAFRVLIGGGMLLPPRADDGSGQRGRQLRGLDRSHVTASAVAPPFFRCRVDQCRRIDGTISLRTFFPMAHQRAWMARRHAGAVFFGVAHRTDRLAVSGSRTGCGRHRGRVPSASPTDAPRQPGLRHQLRLALRDRSYLCLNAGFFACGFHIAFLVTHWPGDLRMCGLAPSVAANSLALVGIFNVGGSLGIGWLGGRYRMKYLLAMLYASRAVVLICYLLMPKTALNVYIVAASLGVSWLATVPPTAGLVGKLFGTRYLTTLFGLTLLSHQIGGFLGAWLGGVAMAQLGSYQWVWYADIVLALLAALVNFPIREALPERRLPLRAPA